MVVETNVKTVGEEKGTEIVTVTTVEEKMSVEKFLATYAQKESQLKQMEAQLEMLTGMLNDIKKVKTSRDMSEVRKLLDKMLRPDKLEEQKTGLEKNIKDLKEVVDNLKPLFEKNKDKLAKANKEEGN